MLQFSVVFLDYLKTQVFLSIIFERCILQHTHKKKTKRKCSSLSQIHMYDSVLIVILCFELVSFSCFVKNCELPCVRMVLSNFRFLATIIPSVQTVTERSFHQVLSVEVIGTKPTVLVLCKNTLIQGWYEVSTA